MGMTFGFFAEFNPNSDSPPHEEPHSLSDRSQGRGHNEPTGYLYENETIQLPHTPYNNRQDMEQQRYMEQHPDMGRPCIKTVQDPWDPNMYPPGDFRRY